MFSLDGFSLRYTTIRSMLGVHPSTQVHETVCLVEHPKGRKEKQTEQKETNPGRKGQDPLT